jgi:predicted nuclease of predicted toxin-antitoxin system
MLKFLVDMCLSPLTSDFLRENRYDVLHVEEINLASAKDEEILKFAVKDKRILVTQDLDFSRLLALSGSSSPGIITLRLQFPSPTNVNKILDRLLRTIPQNEIEGSLISVDETRVRIRKLPIQPESS